MEEGLGWEVALTLVGWTWILTMTSDSDVELLCPGWLSSTKVKATLGVL